MKTDNKTAFSVSTAEKNDAIAACSIDPCFCTDDMHPAGDGEVLASSQKLLRRNRHVYEELAK